jgi:hypothetical protein
VALSRDLKCIHAMMLRRCFDPRHSSYRWYGAQGIGVCEEWRRSPEAMFAHVGPRPTFDHQLDRIDGTRGYEPGNVRWATPTENVMNRRGMVLIEYRGERLPASAWARAFGLSGDALRRRLKEGWHIAEIADAAVEIKKESITCP